jgi:hypothetical protein
MYSIRMEELNVERAGVCTGEERLKAGADRREHRAEGGGTSAAALAEAAIPSGR